MTIIKPCRLGWDDKENNKEGSCCCNCNFNHTVSGHPCNSDQYKTSIMTKLEDDEGNSLRVCSVGIGYDNSVIIFTKQHGMCEMWQPRKKRLEEKQND